MHHSADLRLRCQTRHVGIDMCYAELYVIDVADHIRNCLMGQCAYTHTHTHLQTMSCGVMSLWGNAVSTGSSGPYCAQCALQIYIFHLLTYLLTYLLVLTVEQAVVKNKQTHRTYGVPRSIVKNQVVQRANFRFI